MTMFNDDPLFDFLNDANAHVRDQIAAQHMAHVWDYAEMLDDIAVARAETAAENAWLRNAELPSYDDMGFEEYEAARVIY